jgi:ATP-dependent RNA helicase SUPV3L1/SUV3
LFMLGAAEDVTGIARGIGYQIVEALGVLERQRVAEEVKGLDQTARATLRKHGVRFGAYHLYVPALLKPGPRSLAAQLWAIKHGGPDMKGLDELQRLAASGRTSFPADKEIQKALYRTVGYRVCGERAVRVDILERLADLIRPALNWREGSPGEKPAAAFGGSCFVVTQAMTSLTGSSGEDFSSILRALGYRMDKRPKPAEPLTPAAAAPDRMQDSEKSETNQSTETVTVEASTSGEPVADLASMPEADSPKIAASEMPTFDATIAVAAPADEAALAPAVPDACPAPIAGPDAASEAASAAPEVAVSAEPQFIEVWRVGRSEERRGPRRHRRGAGRHAASSSGEQPDTRKQSQLGSTDATQPAASEQSADSRDQSPPASRNSPEDQGARSRGRRRRPEHRQKSEGERLHGAERAPRPDRAEKPRRSDRGRHRDEDRPLRTWVSANERRGKEPDPNSPFAKLAALKAQLEANAKEPN